MSLYSVAQGGVVNAADVLQFYQLLTGSMTDQPVTIGNSLTVTGNVSAGSGPLNAIANHWTTYTPSWTATTTNPSLGNGTIAARYAKVGLDVYYAGVIIMGSTTTFGSGNWQISLPVAAWDYRLTLGSLECFDANGSDHSGTCFALSGSTLVFSPGTSEVTATNPQTWAVNDELHWSIVYEANS